jgi:hypothetical protein
MFADRAKEDLSERAHSSKLYQFLSLYPRHSVKIRVIRAKKAFHRTRQETQRSRVGSHSDSAGMNVTSISTANAAM